MPRPLPGHAFGDARHTRSMCTLVQLHAVPRRSRNYPRFFAFFESAIRGFPKGSGQKEMKSRLIFPRLIACPKPDSAQGDMGKKKKILKIPGLAGQSRDYLVTAHVFMQEPPLACARRAFADLHATSFTRDWSWGARLICLRSPLTQNPETDMPHSIYNRQQTSLPVASFDDDLS